MKTVSVGEAKNNLPVLLHFVEEKKETIQITRHGKPVGRIVPETEESSNYRKKEDIKNKSNRGGNVKEYSSIRNKYKIKKDKI